MTADVVQVDILVESKNYKASYRNTQRLSNYGVRIQDSLASTYRKFAMVRGFSTIIKQIITDQLFRFVGTRRLLLIQLTATRALTIDPKYTRSSTYGTRVATACPNR